MFPFELDVNIMVLPFNKTNTLRKIQKKRKTTIVRTSTHISHPARETQKLCTVISYVYYQS